MLRRHLLAAAAAAIVAGTMPAMVSIGFEL